jgi:hypothetical protein
MNNQMALENSWELQHLHLIHYPFIFVSKVPFIHEQQLIFFLGQVHLLFV